MTTHPTMRATRRTRILTLALGVAALVGAVRPASGAPGAVASSTVPAAETVLVARRDLPRGVAITATDFDVVVNASPSRARSDTRSDARPGLGWVTRRVVRKGEPLRPPTVAPPPVIHSGSPVTVVWLVDGIRVTREGTALGTAHAGERVVVRVDAQRRVTGVASGPGLVTVAPLSQAPRATRARASEPSYPSS
ncbi:MAG TPA: flagellar basal body P-ring formation chaperone FlgA [Gemmatimonadaceae bacterium]|nr:flagellar basal body P-ring formation chaperone FlgA [Gemmatimonadaceae bacterium]